MINQTKCNACSFEFPITRENIKRVEYNNCACACKVPEFYFIRYVQPLENS